eukprot:1095973-Pleurochrysis_carterae.AAC.1
MESRAQGTAYARAVRVFAAAGAAFVKEPIGELSADELGMAAAEAFRTRRHDVALESIEPAGIAR